MNNELLPCPFCGNTEPKLVPKGSAPEAFVYCGKCDLTANLTEIAIKKWNARASKSAPVERIPYLSEAIKRLDETGEINRHNEEAIEEAARAYLALQGGD